MKLFCFDLETTGFGYDKCGIVQLGAIIVDVDEETNKFKPLDAINLKMCPPKGKWIDKRSFDVTGFSEEEIRSWTPSKQAFKKLIQFLDKYVDRFNKSDKLTILGYNSLHFDIDFLRQWFIDNGNNFFGAYFWSNSIDVFSEATRYFLHYRPAFYNFKLGTVVKAMNLEINNESLHDGLYDIKMTLKIFLKIMKSEYSIKPFNAQEATELYEKLMIEKSKEIPYNPSISQEEAWIQI